MTQLEIIDEVNEQVNALPYKTDLAAYQTTEFWTDIREKGEGDCDDYMIAKGRELKKRGFTDDQLHCAACYWNGGAHAVLIVRLDDGDYILSNGMRPVPVMEMGRAGLAPISMQVKYGEPGWVEWTGAEETGDRL